MTSLTYREKQVIHLLSMGQTAKEIARTLDLAHRTVEKYGSTLRKKLRAKNMTHAVSIVLQNGIL